MGETGAQAIISLGANLPFGELSPRETIVRAVPVLAGEGAVIRAVSRFYATPCFPAGAGPDYVNAALRIETSLSAARLLGVLHRVEARFGRARAQRWGMRTLDLDLVCMGDRVLPDPRTQAAWRDLPPDEQLQRTPDGLILPHPRLQDRAFVLIPMRDVAPGWRHPLDGRTVEEMCAALPSGEVAMVRPL